MVDLNGNGKDDSLEDPHGYGSIATGDISTSSVKVKVPVYQPWIGGKPRGGIIEGTSTVTTAVNNFAAAYSMGSPLGKYISEALVASGMVKPNANLKQMVSAYSAALTMTARMVAGGNKDANVFQGMAYIGGGATSGSGAKVTKIKYFTTYSDEQVTQRAKSAYNAILGHEPSDAEIS